MVARILSSFCLLLIASVVAAAGLKTQLDFTTLALGEPLTLTLAGGALEQIDLAPLAVDFEVRGRTLSRSGDAETLVLTLYPLRAGRLDLPALQADAARSRPARVTVTAGSSDTPQVLFRVETDPAATHPPHPGSLRRRQSRLEAPGAAAPRRPPSPPWFDPGGGRLESLTLNGDEVNIVNPALAALARGFALLLAVGMTAAPFVWMARRLAWRRHKRRGLAAVAASMDTEALLRAVRGFSLAARPRPAATLGVWRDRLRAEARCEGLEALIDALEHARYGGVAGDFTALRARAIRVLAACRLRPCGSGG